MIEKETCPECKGQGGAWHKILTKPCWEYREGEPVEKEWHRCPTCDGHGKLSRLGLAIYKARGGPAPSNQMKGFA